jgi:sucrose-6-phosphate hydrolase SacC (GH32 family)
MKMTPLQRGMPSRRSLLNQTLLSAGGLFLCSAAKTSSGGQLATWNFRDADTLSDENVSGIHDSICSRTCKPPLGKGVADGALRLDGYSTWLTRRASLAPVLEREFTIEAVSALEAYPTAEAAFINQRNGELAGYFFGIDQFGFVHLNVSLDGVWRQCNSRQPVPRWKWTHLAATLDSSGLIALYQDGTEVGSAEGRSGRVRIARTVDLLIGKTNGCSYIGDIFPSAVMNGLIDRITIHGRCLTAAEIRSASEAISTPAHLDLALPIEGDPHRPVYHALPARAWTNEPHGLIEFAGKYHLFYQKNANGPYWGQINWGHLTSPNLLQWTDHAPALSPEPGPDAAGCWSGSITRRGNELAILYTAGDGHKPSICLATSPNGVSFSKFAQNPVIPESPAELSHPDFRDPFVWREGETYYLIIGSGIPGVGGTALLYKSADLVHWTFLHKLLQGDKESSGTFWEMPVFFPLGNKHVLIVCEVPGRASYWIGDWKDEHFSPDQTPPRRLEILNHFLSPTPYRDAQGRTLAIGIIPDTRRPTEAWKAGWTHCYSAPRVLSLDEHGALCQSPLPELERLRGARFSLAKQRLNSGQDIPLTGVRGKAVEIGATFARGTGSRTGFRLRRSDDGQEETTLFYDWAAGTITVDRSRSSLNPDVARTVDTGPFTLHSGESLQFHILLDHSLLEVFVNGRGTLTSRIYPTREDSDGIGIFCDGQVDLESLDIWQMNYA